MRPEVGQILVGGLLVTVPRGYIQAETEYTKEELRCFDALYSGSAKEIARTRVLEKRLEFYDLYMAGNASIKKLVPVVRKETMWRRFQYYAGLR